jgi:hypothetical protein
MRTRADLALALALLVALLATPWRGSAWAQVSPGPLSAAHAGIDAPLKCLECHGQGGAKAGRTDMDARCLACHKEVAWMRTANRGFHVRVANKPCASCHPDHGGRDFQLVVWDEGAAAKFDHRRAGFVLEGKHARLECAACHKPALQKSPAAALIRKKDRTKSWIGLETRCADCHDDVHRGQLGVKCETCHTQAAWKPAPGFDHARTDYALTGAHGKVECMKCHAAPQFSKGLDAKGQPLAQWKPLPHADCTPCHRDPHAGRFKGACAKCHTTQNFHVISREGFNHDQTRYPLKSKHAQVACEKCHDPAQGGFGSKPKFALCTDCHADAHNGMATLAGKPADCAACHDLTGFANSTYTVAAHQKSAYPLEGAHAAADCAACHRQLGAKDPAAAALGTARVMIRPAHAACVDCHGDPHRGRFRPPSPRARKADCLACHGMNAFSPAQYDAKMHFECDFKLEGAHMTVPCQACHEELKAPSPKSTLLAAAASLRPLTFESKKRLCAECHDNPHGDQFAHRKDKGACQGCHGNDEFVPAAKFSHDRDSRFKLEGAHKRIACRACHEPRAAANGKTIVTYIPTPTRCEACHAGGVPDSTAAPKKSSFLPAHGRGDAGLLAMLEEARDGARH